ncbi:ankyrin [Coprinellus micaceus]|uniref:Ankyrin n=1 Tax=Coprinellus micaceus TaxID=71717 RepID=A0A4Y7SGU0_COPMI|nr:ankyrin [Coprinellus micaceus]
MSGAGPDVLNHPFKDGRLALEVACRSKDWRLVQALVLSGAAVNGAFQGPKDGAMVALHAACHDGALTIIYLLLEKAPKSYDDRNWGYYSFPLSFAAFRGELDLLARLLTSGADPNLKDHAGRSPLHDVSNNIAGDVNIAQCLLDFKADPNLTSNDGDTPLHHACSCGHVEIVKCLLRHNADPSTRDKNGKTALQLAREENGEDSEIVKILLGHNSQ